MADPEFFRGGGEWVHLKGTSETPYASRVVRSGKGKFTPSSGSGERCKLPAAESQPQTILGYFDFRTQFNAISRTF